MKLYALLSRLALCVALLGTTSYIVSMVRGSSLSDFTDYSYSESDSSDSDSDAQYSSKSVQEPFETLTLDQKAIILTTLENSKNKEAKKLYTEHANLISLDDIKSLLAEFSAQERAAIVNAAKKPTDQNIRKIKDVLVRAYLNANKGNTEALNALYEEAVYEGILSYYGTTR